MFEAQVATYVCCPFSFRARTTGLLVPSPAREFCENNPGLTSRRSPRRLTSRRRGRVLQDALNRWRRVVREGLLESTSPQIRCGRVRRGSWGRTQEGFYAPNLPFSSPAFGAKEPKYGIGAAAVLERKSPGTLAAGEGCVGCGGSNMTCTRSTSLGRSRYGAYGLCTLLFNYCIRMLRCSTAKMQIASYLHYC